MFITTMSAPCDAQAKLADQMRPEILPNATDNAARINNNVPNMF